MVQCLTKTLRRTLNNLCLLDSSVLAFLLYFNFRLLWAPESEDSHVAQAAFQGALLLSVLGAVLCRGELITNQRARGITHRFIMMISVLGLYLVAMREALFALKPTLLDSQLATIDTLIFGVVPAQWLEQFARPLVTEWFAFFYFSYFTLIGIAIFPSAFLGRSELSRGLVLGPILIVCIGHVGYTLIPGRGPYVALHFKNELQGGYFWDLVNQAVTAQGALLDIFPSLHTAMPCFLLGYLFVRRRLWPFKFPWVIAWSLILFFTVNIIIATMFLRWHYGVDVIAGALLALMVIWLVCRYNPSDEVRASKGRHPIFEPCFGSSLDRDKLQNLSKKKIT